MSSVLESSLEEPFRVLLQGPLALAVQGAARSTERQVAIIARGELSAGQWSQPDLLMACIYRYRSRSVSELALYSFELKVARGFDVRSVHQGLAHSRYAHYSHLAIYCPSDEIWTSAFAEVGPHAQRHGVGVIRLGGTPLNLSYEIPLRSSRFDPEPALVDQFLDHRIPQLLEWIEGRLQVRSVAR